MSDRSIFGPSAVSVGRVVATVLRAVFFTSAIAIINHGGSSSPAWNCSHRSSDRAYYDGGSLGAERARKG